MEVPMATRVGEVGVATEDSNGAVSVSPPSVFHVHVVDAVGEFTDEFDVVDALVAEVGGVVIKAEAFMVTDGFEGAL